MPNAIKIIGAGQQEFRIAVSANVSQTFSIYAQYDTNYVGPKPKFEILENLQIGVPAQTASMQGPAGIYEQLSCTITPTATGIVIIRVSAQPSDTAAGLFATPILDNFDRADENPFAGSNGRWLRADPSSNTSALTTNQLDLGTTKAWAYDLHEQLGEWFEVYCTLSTIVNTISLGKVTRNAMPGNASLGISYTVTSSLIKFKVGTIGFPASFSNGDKFGIRIDGTGLSVYKNTGSGWIALYSFGLSDIAIYQIFPKFGNPGVGGVSATIDDFGGGNITPVSYFDSFSVS